MLPLIQQTISDIYQSVSHFIIANMVTELTLLAMFILVMVTQQHLSTWKADKEFKPAYSNTELNLLEKHQQLKNRNKGN